MDPATAQLPLTPPLPTMAAALRARLADSAARVFLRFEERSWTYAQTFATSSRFANVFLRRRDADPCPLSIQSTSMWEVPCNAPGASP